MPNQIEPIFIYNNKLKFDKYKKFTLQFSNDDEITEVLFKQFKDYFISMDCFIELSNDVKRSTQYKRIKEIQDITNNILISHIDFGLLTKHRSHFTETIECFDFKKKWNTNSKYWFTI